MKNHIGKLLVPVLLLALAGCNLPFSPPPPSAYQPTVATLPSGEDCLVGTFELNDFGDSVASMLPKAMQYTGTTGRMRWTFEAGGIVEATADHFSLSFQDTQDPTVIITVTMSGTARRFYTLSGINQITFSNADDSEFSWSEVISGVTISLDPIFKALAPLPPSDGSLRYTCEVLSLTIYPNVAGAKPLGLTKVGP